MRSLRPFYGTPISFQKRIRRYIWHILLKNNSFLLPHFCVRIVSNYNHKEEAGKADLSAPERLLSVNLAPFVN